ncbi:cytosolic phospholipase A2 gamma-like isoform X1 [Pygocentrus nattereri]|uniref:Phospholipase A2, group IVC (cytosolic, calcium-independent) n=1 Tax=Pygocentrus nattereri TaxID=42514 RepID=A0A3B4DR33_PYGNA|nr:cytosolic phospholipase A2 gamma-like isoform X1 [Pygocentrus nattereri]XP_017575574.1 cytosolic phospholipase A2 gamma-like isoform X1 [Pygocentrus nattereri]
MEKGKKTKSSEVRVGHCLNEAEKLHVARRRKSALQCLKQHNILCREDEVPNIAVLGSGGGLRAMVGLLGSLCQLKEDGLLDCIMYLSGVSGSVWCMASLYKEPDWSTKLETVKDTIVRRLADGSVSWWKMGQKLMQYYSEKDNFSLTDVWAALIVSNMVKEIDEHRISEQRGNYTNEPYPIYTVIDNRMSTDPWFEITPDESGYSLSGVFVDSSSWGSLFKKGKKIKDQPEMDMLYLQGLCGSVMAHKEELLKALHHMIPMVLSNPEKEKANTNLTGGATFSSSPVQLKGEVHQEHQVLLTLLGLHVSTMVKENPKFYLNTMDDLLKGKKSPPVKPKTSSEGPMSETELKTYTLHVCNSFSHLFEGRLSPNKSEKLSPNAFGGKPETSLRESSNTLIDMFTKWIWGTSYNYLHGMTVEGVNPSVLKAKTRGYIDAGLLLNLPYFSVLRKERDIDLIVSLDFGVGDPFETVYKAAAMCKDLQIPFPKVDVPPGEKAKPKDFYVFKDDTKAPTVIHIPLFNDVNCKGEVEKWRQRYQTFQMSYSHEMISDLLEKVGLNIKNNKMKLLKEVKNIIEERKLLNMEKPDVYK